MSRIQRISISAVLSLALTGIAWASGFPGGGVTWPLTAPAGLGAVAQINGPSDQPLTLQSKSAGTGILLQSVSNNSWIDFSGDLLMRLRAPGSVQLQPNGGATNYMFDATSFRCSAGGPLPLGNAASPWAQLYVNYTNTATVGNVSLGTAAGRVNLAAAGTTLTVTDNLCTAASHVFLNFHSAPGNAVAVQLYAVAGAGSFTVNCTPAVTNQTAIDFFIVNAD